MVVGAQNTEIGRKARRLEALITRKLYRVFKNEIKPLLGTMKVDTLRNSMIGEKVHDIIRSGVELGYFTGSIAVSGFLKEDNPITTEQDLSNIEFFTTEMESEFWGMVEKQEDRAEEVEIVDNQEQALLPYNERAAVLGIGSFIAFYAVMNGVQTKAIELVPTINALPPTEVLARFGRKALINLQRMQATGGPVTPMVLVYLTASDSIVDPIFCKPLHRKVFQLDDNLPPLPQHRHCRCVLVLRNTLTGEYMI